MYAVITTRNVIDKQILIKYSWQMVNLTSKNLQLKWHFLNKRVLNENNPVKQSRD